MHSYETETHMYVVIHTSKHEYIHEYYILASGGASPLLMAKHKHQQGQSKYLDV